MSLVRKGIILEQVGSGVKVTFPSGEPLMVLCAMLTGDTEEQDNSIIQAKKPKDYRPAPFGGVAR